MRYQAVSIPNRVLGFLLVAEDSKQAQDEEAMFQSLIGFWGFCEFRVREFALPCFYLRNVSIPNRVLGFLRDSKEEVR